MASSGVKIEGLLGMLTIKLTDKNFSKWVFQFKSVLKGYKLFDNFDGTAVCPPKFVIDTTPKFVIDTTSGVTNVLT